MILKVGNKKIEKFNSIDITLKYDSVASTFAFSFYYDVEKGSPIGNIGNYARCVIEDDGEVLITGTILSPTYQDGSVKSLSGISGYSVTGVLEDCQIPIELYPLQSDGKSLKEITERLIKKFGFGLVIDQGKNFKEIIDKANEVIETSIAEASQSIKAYLATIASQKNIIISHTPNGSLRFTRSYASGKSKYTFESGQPNVSINVVFSGQPMHSEITVVKQADIDGGNAGEATVKNPYVNTYRPRVILQTSGSDVDSLQAAKNALAEELKNIRIVITIGGLDKWRYSGNKLRPNTLIDVVAPECRIKKRTQFFVEQVQLIENTDSGQTAILSCVVPEVHNGQTPFNRFS
jgi:prophage tail gpP-like protein